MVLEIVWVPLKVLPTCPALFTTSSFQFSMPVVTGTSRVNWIPSLLPSPFGEK